MELNCIKSRVVQSTKGEAVKDIDLLVMGAEPWNKVSNKTVEQSL